MYPDRNLSLLCLHAINDIQDVSVGLGLQVVRLVLYGSAFKLCSVPNLSLTFWFRLRFKEGTEYNFITGSIEKTTVLLNIIKVLDSQATEPKCSLGR